jgi:hypothetical protein
VDDDWRAELIMRRGGFPEWEVRIDPPSRDQVGPLARRLRAEGLRVARYSNHLLIGCASQDEAARLVERVHGEAPEGAGVRAEGAAAFLRASFRQSSFLGKLAN